MRAALRLFALGMLLCLGATAAPGAGAQAGGLRVYAPLASRGCSGAPICASLEVGPEGICCVGGRPGDTARVPIRIMALSSAGLPLELISDRALCSSTAPIQDASWEPYAAAPRLDTVTLAPNWTTYALRVQLRDSAGNLSPVLCDDVALEGF